MFKSKIVHFFVVMLTVLFSNVQAQKIDKANPFFIGHSLINFDMPQMVNELAKAGGKPYQYNQQICNGAPLWWNFENYAGCQGTPYVNAFPDGNHDVLIITEAVPLQNHLDWSNTYDNAKRFYRYALEHNMEKPVRFYLYETWHCINTGTSAGCEWDNGDSLTWVPRLKNDLRLWSGIVDQVRDAFPDEEVWMIPAGQAFYHLSKEIELGNVPGIEDFTDLFSDDIHLNNKGNYFVALVMYACIFRESPEGLSNVLKDRYGTPFSQMPTAIQAAMMQKVVWQTVRELEALTGVVQTTSGTKNSFSEEKDLLIFPNPASGFLRVITPLSSSEYQIFDVSGTLVLKTTDPETDISALRPGIYVVKSGFKVRRFVKT